MSQEEEKLIEEFTEKIKLNFDNLGGTSYGVTETEAKILAVSIPFILKSYRAGKLAGFEMCEKMADEMTTGLDMLNQIDAGKVFAIGTFKSLIEEEKKKL